MTTSTWKLSFHPPVPLEDMYIPAFSSSFALLRLSMISVIDLIDPFLKFSSDPALRIAGTHGTARHVHLEVTSDEELATHVYGRNLERG